MEKIALITGASTGIGYATTQTLIHRGWIVYGSVRKEMDALRLSSDFGRAFKPLIFDVTDHDAIVGMANQLEKELDGTGLDILLNNAGIANGGPLQHIPFEEIKQQFDVNVLGLLAVTKYFLPLLGARENHQKKVGRILNVSSVSGKLGFPFMIPYVATKHAVEGITSGLRRELLGYGIDVIALRFGPIKTPIWDKIKNSNTYQDTAYIKPMNKVLKHALDAGNKGLEVDYIGQRIADICEAKRPRPHYSITPQKFLNYTLPRIMPARMFDKLLKLMFEF